MFGHGKLRVHEALRDAGVPHVDGRHTRDGWPLVYRDRCVAAPAEKVDTSRPKVHPIRSAA